MKKIKVEGIKILSIVKIIKVYYKIPKPLKNKTPSTNYIIK